MRNIDIAEFQSSLPTYLALATAGETILIRDDKTPVAQLIPAAADPNTPPSSLLPLTGDDFSAEDLALAAEGKMTLPKYRMDWDAFWKMPMPTVKENALTQALLDEREEGR